jgi:hypothetical protein
MRIPYCLLAVLLVGCATTGPRLTSLEQEKLDPALQRLVLGASPSPAEYDVTPGPSGEELFGVVVRTDDVDHVRSAGYDVSSAFGGIAIVRVTITGLRALVKLPSVKNVTNGSKNKTQ